jgi:hypothetical protein
MNATLRTGFETMERVFTARHHPPAQPTTNGLDRLLEGLTATMQTTNTNQAAFVAMQRESNAALQQSLQGIQQVTQMTATLLAELVKEVRRTS